MQDWLRAATYRVARVTAADGGARLVQWTGEAFEVRGGEEEAEALLSAPHEPVPDVAPEVWERIRLFLAAQASVAGSPQSPAARALVEQLLQDPGFPALLDCLQVQFGLEMTVRALEAVATTLGGVPFLGGDVLPFLLAGLQHPHDSVRALVLRHVPVEGPMDPEALLPAMADALLSQSASVGEQAAARLLEPSQDAALVAAQLRRLLDGPAAGDDQLRMRVLDVAVRLSALGEGGLAAAGDAGLLEALAAAAFGGEDALLQLVALELVPRLCATGPGLAFAAAQGWLGRLSATAGSDEDPMAQASALQCLADVCAAGGSWGAVGADVVGALFAALAAVLALEDAEDAHVGAANALGTLCAAHGDAARRLAADAALLRSYAAMATARGERRAAFLHTLATLLEAPLGCDEASDPRVAVLAAVAAAADCESFAQYLVQSLELPFEETRVAALHAAQALASIADGWGVRLLLSNPLVVQHCSQHRVVNTKATRLWRHALLHTVVHHPLADSLDADTLAVFRALEARGPAARATAEEEPAQVAEEAM